MLNYVKKNILEYVDVEPEAITEDTRFIRDLHINSYDFISIIGKVETELNIEIPDMEMREIETVGDMADFLRRRLE